MQKSSLSPASEQKNSKSQFGTRPFAIQPQSQLQKPPAQQEIENQEFQQDKHEGWGLGIQTKHDPITPEGQAQPTVLQARIDSYRPNRRETTQRHSTNLLAIPNLFAPRQTVAPLPKLLAHELTHVIQQNGTAVRRNAVSSDREVPIQRVTVEATSLTAANKEAKASDNLDLVAKVAERFGYKGDPKDAKQYLYDQEYDDDEIQELIGQFLKSENSYTKIDPSEDQSGKLENLAIPAELNHEELKQTAQGGMQRDRHFCGSAATRSEQASVCTL